MATYNSLNYATDIGSPTAANGIATTSPLYGLAAQDAVVNGAVLKKKVVQFSTTTTPLAAADVINVATLPPGSRVTSIKLSNDVATASATVQLGVTGTPAFYSVSALSVASGNTRAEAFTNVTNLDQANQLAVTTTIIATIAGAAIPAGVKLFFEIDYLTN